MRLTGFMVLKVPGLLSKLLYSLQPGGHHPQWEIIFHASLNTVVYYIYSVMFFSLNAFWHEDNHLGNWKKVAATRLDKQETIEKNY